MHRRVHKNMHAQARLLRKRVCARCVCLRANTTRSLPIREQTCVCTMCVFTDVSDNYLLKVYKSPYRAEAFWEVFGTQVGSSWAKTPPKSMLEK